MAEFGIRGRVVVFYAEYNALADISHTYRHNLIATASIAAFLSAVDILKASNLPGRMHLLGCPAEEGGGGKIKLLEAGAFSDIDAALMAHPGSGKEIPNGLIGVAYGICSAATGFQATFQSKAAYAGAMPWIGVNALDTALLTYTAVGLLR
jgi:metal-dependent amidase/aminoacylase/carboxypeptidase family protein